MSKFVKFSDIDTLRGLSHFERQPIIRKAMRRDRHLFFIYLGSISALLLSPLLAFLLPRSIYFVAYQIALLTFLGYPASLYIYFFYFTARLKTVLADNEYENNTAEQDAAANP